MERTEATMWAAVGAVAWATLGAGARLLLRRRRSPREQLGERFRTALDARRAFLVSNRELDSVEPPARGLLDNCTLMLPRNAVEELGLVPNIEDKGEEKLLWFGRVWQLRALEGIRYKRRLKERWGDQLEREIAALKKNDGGTARALAADPVLYERIVRLQARWRGQAARSASSLKFLEALRHTDIRGYVLYMHGSGGMTVNNMRYARILAGMGYLVIAPDHMASSDERQRELAPHFTYASDTDYWSKDLCYRSATFGKLAYSTAADAVLADPRKYRELYESVFSVRSAELAFTLDRLPPFVQRQGVFTMGTSEGAMTVARFDDRRFGHVINGRVISAFSCEYCYFTPTREAGRFGGNLTVPTLNIIGDLDQYFGPPPHSVAGAVSQSDVGYGKERITGNAFETMQEQQLERGLVVVLRGAQHDPTITHDNEIRDIFEQFFSKPHFCHRIDEQLASDQIVSSLLSVRGRVDKPTSKLLYITLDQSPLPPQLGFREKELAVLGRLPAERLAAVVAQHDEQRREQQSESDEAMRALAGMALRRPLSIVDAVKGVLAVDASESTAAAAAAPEPEPACSCFGPPRRRSAGVP